MTLVYVPDSSIEWAPAELVEKSEDDNSITVKLFDVNGKLILSSQTLSNVETPLQNLDKFGKPDVGCVDDLTDLGHLHEASILYSLRRRHQQNHPYTYVGEIVLAVNPYKWLPIYSEELRQSYATQGGRRRGGGGSSQTTLPPHVYSVSVSAYERMAQLEDKDNKAQSILVSGESGAGKTETTKILMAHMASISTGGEFSHETVDAIVKSNPLLESFGNARTLRNDNSSRFGKFIQLQFGPPVASGHFSSTTSAERTLCPLLGAVSKTYLLEKTRILAQQTGERNYHIFYQVLAGLPTERLIELKLDRQDEFRYLRRDTPGVIEGNFDKEHFQATTAALQLVGVEACEQASMWTLLGGILRLGEVDFGGIVGVEAEGGAPAARLSSGDAEAAELLGVDMEALQKALTERALVARGETYSVKLSLLASGNCRDALAKHLYTSLFDWLVSRINARISTTTSSTARWVGLLDIFGFENFDVNSYEQLMINYANEKLQQKFTADLFTSVQHEYIEQGLEWSNIAYRDNSSQVLLLEGKGGIIEAMNEELRTTGQDISFVQKLKGSTADKSPVIKFPRFSSKADQSTFTICHYAGDVVYNAAHGSGFLAKHKDALFPDLKRLLTTSNIPFMQTLFSDESFALFASPEVSGGGRRRAMSALGAVSVGSQFKQSLAQLLSVLSTSEAHYVRCVKPNTNKLSGGNGDGTGGVGDAFHMKMVAEQLRCAGVVEAVRVSRSAYPNRFELGDFMSRFSFLKPTTGDSTNSSSPQQACKALLTSLELTDVVDYQVGRSRVYFSGGVLEVLEAKYHTRKLQAAVTVEATVRMFLRRSAYIKLLTQVVSLQACTRQWLAVSLYIKTISGIILVQTVARMRGAKAQLLHRQRCYKSTRLQAWFRRKAAQFNYKRHREAVCVIQCIARGGLGRAKYQTTLQEKKRQSDATLQVEHLRALLVEQQSTADSLRRRLDAQAEDAKRGSLRVGEVAQGGEEVDYLREALREAKLQLEGHSTSSEFESLTPNLEEAHALAELRSLSQRLSEEVKEWRDKCLSEQSTCAQLRVKCERLSNSMAGKEAKSLELRRELETLKSMGSPRSDKHALVRLKSSTSLESLPLTEKKQTGLIESPLSQVSDVSTETAIKVRAPVVETVKEVVIDSSRLDLCQSCHVDEVKNRHQLLPCTDCGLVFHTHCAKAKRIPFNLTDKEREHRARFVLLNLADFSCPTCTASASPPGSPSMPSTLSRRAKGNAARAQTLKTAMRVRKRKPALTVVPDKESSQPVVALTPLEALTKQVVEKDCLLSKLVLKLKQDAYEFDGKLAEKQFQLEYALEAQRYAEAVAQDSNSRADFAAERLAREKAIWEQEQAELVAAHGVLVAADELAALRACAENFVSEMEDARVETEKLRQRVLELETANQRRGFFGLRGPPAVTTPEKANVAEDRGVSGLLAELEYAEMSAGLMEKDMSRDQLLTKTAEQLHDAMNSRLELELMLEDRDRQLAEVSQENESLHKQRSAGTDSSTKSEAAKEGEEGAKGRLRSLFGLGGNG